MSRPRQPINHGHQVSCEWDYPAPAPADSGTDLAEDSVTVPDGAYALNEDDALEAARVIARHATDDTDRDELLAMCGLVGATPVPAAAPASGRRAWPDAHRRTTKPRGRP